MLSETAIETLEDFRVAGLKPTDADVIRLNALGLKLEAANKKHAATDSNDYLPRVAQVTPSLAFRQPTIGHEIWLEKVGRFVRRGDYLSALAVNAYALSRPPSELPDGDSPEAVAAAVSAFCESCRDLTRDQIYAAIDYVTFGASPILGENPPPEPHEPDGSDAEDWKSCVAIGVLHEGAVMLYGVTQSELESMTRQQVEEMIRRAWIFRGLSVPDDVRTARDNYYATVAEIRARLESNLPGHSNQTIKQPNNQTI